MEYKDSESAKTSGNRLEIASSVKDSNFDEHAAELFSLIHKQMDEFNVPAMIETCNSISELFTGITRFTDTASFKTARIPALCFNNLQADKDPALILSTIHMVNILTKVEDAFEDLFLGQENFISLLHDMLASSDPKILAELISTIANLMHFSFKFFLLTLDKYSIVDFQNIFNSFPGELYDSFSYLIFIISHYDISKKDKMIVLHIVGDLYKMNVKDSFLRLVSTLVHVLNKWDGEINLEIVVNTGISSLIDSVLKEATLDNDELLIRACECVALLQKQKVFVQVDYERIKSLTIIDETPDNVRCAAFNAMIAILKYSPASDLINTEYIGTLIEHLDIVTFNFKKLMVTIIIGFGLVSSFEVLDEMIENGFLDIMAKFLDDIYPSNILSSALLLLRKIQFEYYENDCEMSLGSKLIQTKENPEEEEEEETEVSAGQILKLVKNLVHSDDHDLAKEAAETYSALTEIPGLSISSTNSEDDSHGYEESSNDSEYSD